MCWCPLPLWRETNDHFRTNPFPICSLFPPLLLLPCIESKPGNLWLDFTAERCRLSDCQRIVCTPICIGCSSFPRSLAWLKKLKCVSLEAACNIYSYFQRFTDMWSTPWILFKSNTQLRGVYCIRNSNNKSDLCLGGTQLLFTWSDKDNLVNG